MCIARKNTINYWPPTIILKKLTKFTKRMRFGR